MSDRTELAAALRRWHEVAAEPRAIGSDHAELVAERIDRYLAINGHRTVGAKIAAVRAVYGRAFRRHLAVPATLTARDVADGVDLLIARLLDQAQAEYDATTPAAGGKTQPAAYYLEGERA